MYASNFECNGIDEKALYYYQEPENHILMHMKPCKV